MLRRSPHVAVLALAVVVAAPRVASADSPVSLRLEATVGGAWRTSIDSNDRNSSFDVGALQAEIALGPGWGPLALLVGARGRIGAVAGPDSYRVSSTSLRFPTESEASGSLGFQFAIGERVRARVGGSGGMMWVGDLRAPLAGGFLAATFDAATWKSGRLGAIVALRFDVDGVISDDTRLPHVSTSFGVGFGLRY